MCSSSCLRRVCLDIAYLSRGQGDTVAASHLLIKHLGSRRAASWKDESGAEITKRTKDMAQSILLKHR